MAEVRRTPQAETEKEVSLISTAERKKDVTDIDHLLRAASLREQARKRLVQRLGLRNRYSVTSLFPPWESELPN